MQKNKDIEKTIKLKDNTIKMLDTYLTQLLQSTSYKDNKKSSLISFWLKDYINYIKCEDTFLPMKQENYKRGNIIKANLGFNIGNEEGGLHYAIVINNPDKSSGLVTIVPLTSRKKNETLHHSEVSLGYSLINDIIDKLKILSINLQNDIKEIKLINDVKERTSKIDKLQKVLSELNKYMEEVSKMKKDESIALVGNITTISKQRIYTPTIKNKFLKGISLSNEQLDLIDSKIKELYTKH